jgi:probable H4MPT-linked C1 transfer pathway protein
LDAVEAAAGDRPTWVWQADSSFAAIAEAREQPERTAAANWLALANYLGRYVPRGAGLAVDMGSTTTDIVPLMDGRPITRAFDDVGRLKCQELLYLGASRTPLCALLGTHGAAEFFATTLDLYLILGLIPEDECNRQTADGRPATRPGALARLARMLCGDLENCPVEDLVQLASRLYDKQLSTVAAALEAVVERLDIVPASVVIAGSGEFVLRESLLRSRALTPVPVISMAHTHSPGLSACACAHAVASLALEATRNGV